MGGASVWVRRIEARVSFYFVSLLSCLFVDAGIRWAEQLLPEMFQFCGGLLYLLGALEAYGR